MFNVVSFNYLDFFGFEKMIERKNMDLELFIAK